MNTTLNRIRWHKPCTDRWSKLLKHLGKTRADDEPLPLATILESNGLDDALWCLRAVEGIDREARLYAVWSARQVQHLMTDPRSLAALDIAERDAKRQSTDDELTAAFVAAETAAKGDAWYAPSYVACATLIASAKVAAWCAARITASAIGNALRSAAARDAAKVAQKAEFRRVFVERRVA
jgi:hypothetical protein